MSRLADNTLLYRSQAPTPVGRLTLAGLIRGGQGVNPTPPWRVYGSYAAVYLVAGQGRYRDVNGADQRVGSGDLMLVFPELPHTYGPDPGTTWDEFYLVFEGPIFDLWRTAGLLDPRHPVHHLEPQAEWLGKMQEVASQSAADVLSGSAISVCRFLSLLTEMVAAGSPAAAGSSEPDWLAAACRRLESDLGGDVSAAQVAAEAGMSYESFRKHFALKTGTSPARYRHERRLDAARDLLRYTQMTSRQIADALGFGDEFSFSKRFKQRFGLSPRAFRNGPVEGRGGGHGQERALRR